MLCRLWWWLELWQWGFEKLNLNTWACEELAFYTSQWSPLQGWCDFNVQMEIGVFPPSLSSWEWLYAQALLAEHRPSLKMEGERRKASSICTIPEEGGAWGVVAFIGQPLQTNWSFRGQLNDPFNCSCPTNFRIAIKAYLVITLPPFNDWVIASNFFLNIKPVWLSSSIKEGIIKNFKIP